MCWLLPNPCDEKITLTVNDQAVKKNSTFLNIPFKIILQLILIFSITQKSIAQDSAIAIVNVAVFTAPYEKPIQNATILIAHGKFEAIGLSSEMEVPLGYRIIDGKGKYVTSGYWNSHVHLIESQWENSGNKAKDSLEVSIREMFTSKGFVYVFDLAQLDFTNLNLLRSRINNGEIKGPTILAVGVPFTSKSPFYIKPLTLPELKTKKEVRHHIEKQLKAGANGIKIWSASPTGHRIDYLSAELIKETARITQKNNIPLFAHPSNLKGVTNAAGNGVTVLAHVAADDRAVWDSTLVNELVDRDIALIPTLKLHFWDLRSANIDTDTSKLIRTAIDQLRVFHDAGGTVLFGTDVGYMNDYDTKEEFANMAAAGMGFYEILASLTTNPAKTFNISAQTGTIQVGKNADLVILEENPVLDARNFSEVVLTIHNGNIIFDKNKLK